MEFAICPAHFADWFCDTSARSDLRLKQQVLRAWSYAVRHQRTASALSAQQQKLRAQLHAEETAQFAHRHQLAVARRAFATWRTAVQLRKERRATLLHIFVRRWRLALRIRARTASSRHKVADLWYNHRLTAVSFRRWRHQAALVAALTRFQHRRSLIAVVSLHCIPCFPTQPPCMHPCRLVYPCVFPFIHPTSLFTGSAAGYPHAPLETACSAAWAAACSRGAFRRPGRPLPSSQAHSAALAERGC